MSAAALPALGVLQWWLVVGWALVIAGGSAALLAWWSVPRSVLRAVAALLALAVCLPGEWSYAYWLGLAFQAPSGAMALACAWLGGQALRGRARPAAVAGAPAVREAWQAESGLALAGVVGGWVLLLDTFAQLPVAVYGLGFGPAAVAAVLLVALLPWLQARAVGRPAAWLVPAAVLLSVTLRLPTGNVFDAVLDPWWWVALHVVVARRAYRYFRP